jgi:hypothetical protein
LSDIEAAHAAGVVAIGDANRGWKVGAFTAAEVAVRSMGDFAETLSPVSPRVPAVPRVGLSCEKCRGHRICWASMHLGDKNIRRQDYASDAALVREGNDPILGGIGGFV